MIKGIEPNDSPERFRGLGVDVIFGNGRFVGARRVRGRRPPPHGEDLRHRHRLATGRSRRSPASTRRPISPTKRCSICASRCPRSSSSAPARSAARWRRRSAGWAATSPSSTSRRASCRAKTPISPPSCIAHARGRRRSLPARRVDRRRAPGATGDVRLTRARADGATTRARRHRTCCWRPAARRTSKASGLDAAGVTLDQGRIVADGGLRTTNPRIYVIGDAAGGYQFTHVAEHHAGIVLRQAIFRMRWAKPSLVVPWCTFTDPELARVGLSETEASERGVAHRVYRFPFDDIDRARAEGETEGFAKIVTDPKGKLLGAAIVGPHAGELIAEYVLALSKGMNAKELTGVDPRVSDARADQPPRRRPAAEGRPDADRRRRGSSASSACRAREMSARPRPTATGRGRWRKIALLALFVGVDRRLLRAGRPALSQPRHGQGAPRRAARVHGRALRRGARHRVRRLRRRDRVQPAGRARAVADDGLHLRPLGRHACSS